jgi:hypothetical protein
MIKKFSVKSPFFKRSFGFGKNGIFKTLSFESVKPENELLVDGTEYEGIVIINGKSFKLGDSSPEFFRYEKHHTVKTPDGGERLEVIFSAPDILPSNLKAVLIYEAPAKAPVLIKSLRIEHESGAAVKLNGVELENFIPSAGGDTSLALDDDFVRDAQTIDGKRVRSPWIEKHHIYINHMLSTESERRKFAYPCPLDIWLVPGERFNSFRIFEFVLPKENETRGLAFRKATREIWPWTCDCFLSCALAPANRVEEYYEQIAQAAEVGYEGVHLHHGWINKKLTSPLFTNYSDYELRPELFPNGWVDVKKLTGFAHSNGLKISFYTIYVNTWRSDDEKPRVDRENSWRILWHPEDKSSRWGNTFDPASDWGMFVNRKMEEAMTLGGFDAWHVDGPYYGDINVAENRGCAPGGSNQALAWKRQVEFYRRMLAHGWHGEAAQGFPAFANGMSRITTTGYVEGDFHKRPIWDLLWNTRKSAYFFTRLYRPEQATTFIPVWPWDFGTDAKPRWLPLEEHLEEYNAALGFVFGYGFEGKCYQKQSYDGPKSKKIVTRWLKFWKDHADFFKKGYLYHVREPDGKNIDAVMHVIENNKSQRVLLVAYNPLDREQADALPLPFKRIGFQNAIWSGVDSAGKTVKVESDEIKVSIPAHGVMWYVLEKKLPPETYK